MTQGLWHKVLWMWIWIGVCLKAEAATYAEAGATTSAPALPVYSAQPFDTDGTALPPDTLTTPDEPDTLLAADAHADTLRLGQVADSLMKRKGRVSMPKKQFVPNPQRALWLSLVFPGAGQIYNRKAAGT